MLVKREKASQIKNTLTRLIDGVARDAREAGEIHGKNKSSPCKSGRVSGGSFLLSEMEEL